MTTPVTRARSVAARAWARGWHLPEQLSVWQWADRHRVLPAETSKEAGRWRTDRNPPARAIMESLSPHSGAEIVTVVAGTQTVKTESMNNLIGYAIDHDPASIIVCQPSKELGNGWKLTRFDALIDSTPQLKAKVHISKRRDSSNTMDRVRYPGGWLIVAHAASAASLGMYSARYVLADEVDSYEELKGAEGDPLKTLHRRADSFGRLRKIYHCSSPKKIMGASLIWREYLAGDQRECYLPCPHCDAYQVLVMEQVLPSGEYLCEHCGTPIPHAAKTDMLAALEWRAKFPERTWHHSYRLPSLYSPIGLGRTWKQLHEERAAAGDDPALLKAFVSTSLAIPYEPPGRLESTDIQEMAEDWPMRQPPRGCLLLVAGTDVQADRLETVILGLGRGPTPKTPVVYVVDYHLTIGAPTDPETWADLAQYLEEPVTNAYGVALLPRLHAVDSGNWTNEVYAACHARTTQGWVAIKGASTATAPLIGPPKRHEYAWSGRAMKYGGAHHIVGTNHAKDTLLDRLAIAPTQPPEQRWWHLPRDLPDTWYVGITSERRDPETHRWEKIAKSARNEAVDTAVYAWAVAHLAGSPGIGASRLVKLQSWTAASWEQLEQDVCPVQGDLFSAAPVQAEPAPAPRAPERAKPARALPALEVFGPDV